MSRTSWTATTDSLGLLMRDLDQYPMPNYDEQVELAKRVAAGDDEAKKQMVAANLRLVLHWARRYADRGVEMVDLVQQHGRTIRIPLEVGEQLQRLEAATAELTGLFGRPPTDDELTEATGMTAAQRKNLEGIAGVTASLDQPANSDSATVLGDLVAPDARNYFDEVDQTMLDDRLSEALGRLSDLQRDVIKMRFGLDGSDPTSLQVTAERLSKLRDKPVGVRQVRRAEAEALATLAIDNDVLGVFRPDDLDANLN